jgi:predicted RecA/RadA family phage recombinase/Flp pilus assembly protein TadG
MCGIAADRSGTVAMIVAFSIIPLIGAVGIATDTARGYLVKSRLQSAVDSAALAGGRVFYDATRDADIQQYFAANFPTGYMDAALQPLTVTPDAANESISLTAQATIPTTFMRLLGTDQMTVKAYAQVKRKTDRLHVVLAMDMSVSMNSILGTQTRLADAQDAAHTLVGILYGNNADNDLLKVGLVPYTGKVNVTYNGTRYGYDSSGNPITLGLDSSYTAADVDSYTNPYPAAGSAFPYQKYSSAANYLWRFASPYGGMARTTVYYAHNSPVPLLTPPPAGWKGCVYARYLGDDSTSADLLLGATTNGGADWPGWQPMGMPRATSATLTAHYSVSSGSGMLDGGTFGVAQGTASSGSTVTAALSGTYTLTKGQTCSYNWYTGRTTCSYPSISAGNTIYWDDTNHVATNSSSGNTRIGTASAYSSSSSHSVSVTLDDNATGDAQSGSNNSSNQSPNAVCLDSHANANSTGTGGRTADCADCPTVGITALQSSRSVVDDAIDGLNIPAGAMYYTNIPDGLAWAWEVLMPTPPFTEGQIADPSQVPPRAIVLMTDGANTCSVGDAYQNYSDCGIYGDNTWRNNRLIALADNIKAQGVLIYAIQFAEPGNAGLLEQVASKPEAPYYYYAPSADDLKNAFTEIANNLSNLRLSR